MVGHHHCKPDAMCFLLYVREKKRNKWKVKGEACAGGGEYERWRWENSQRALSMCEALSSAPPH